MEIIKLWPQTWPGSNVLARFDVRLADDVVLCGLHLKRGRDGSPRAYPPRVGDRSAFHIAPTTAARIAVLASSELERQHAGN